MYIDNKRVIILRALIEESEYFIDDIDEFENNFAYLTKFDSEFFDDKDKLIIIDEDEIKKKSKKNNRDLFLGILIGFVFGIFTCVFYFLLRKKSFLLGIILGSIFQIIINMFTIVVFT